MLNLISELECPVSCNSTSRSIDNVNIYDTFETETETVDHIAECNTIINTESVQLATVSHTKQIHPRVV